MKDKRTWKTMNYET